MQPLTARRLFNSMMANDLKLPKSRETTHEVAVETRIELDLACA
ncbi:MAG: hypothetical protein VCB25_09995 [Myxococcota bacterium]